MRGAQSLGPAHPIQALQSLGQTRENFFTELDYFLTDADQVDAGNQQSTRNRDPVEEQANTLEVLDATLCLRTMLTTKSTRRTV